MNFRSMARSTALLAAGWAVATLAQANDAPTMLPVMQANGCTSCHAMNEKVVGPAFQAIAQKYAGDKDAAASLVQSIQYGSKGKWGRIAMPPHPSLSQDELKQIAQWVLSKK